MQVFLRDGKDYRKVVAPMLAIIRNKLLLTYIKTTNNGNLWHCIPDNILKVYFSSASSLKIIKRLVTITLPALEAVSMDCILPYV